MTTETYSMGSFADEFIWLHNEHARIGAILNGMRTKILSGEVRGPDLVGEEMEIGVAPVELTGLDIERLVQDLGITPEMLDSYKRTYSTPSVVVRAKAADAIPHVQGRV